MDDVEGRAGCVVLVAAAGYGKSAALEAAATGRHCLLVSAAALVGGRRGAGSLPDGVRHLLVDDLDDLDGLDDGGPRDVDRLASTLAALAGDVRLTLASRRPLSGALRAALGRPVVVRPAASLALSAHTTARILRDEHGIDDLDRAEVVQHMTAGWPALVHLAAVGAAPDTWAHDHVVPTLTGRERDVLARAVCLGEISADLLPEGASPEVLEALSDMGVLVPAAPGLGTSSRQVVPMLTGVVPGDTPGPAVLRSAAGTCARSGRPLRAALLLEQVGDDEDCAALLATRGEDMLATGRPAEVVGLVDRVVGRGVADRDRGLGDALALLLGQARRMAGDALGASRAMAPLVARAEATGAWSPALARRVAMVHYSRGDVRAALETTRHPGNRDDDAGTDGSARGDGVEEALLAATEVVCLHAVGDTEGAGRRLPDALALAERSGSPAAVATAHLAAAIGATGSRRDAHLQRAGAAAGAAGDVVLVARVLVHRTDAALAQARYTEAAALALDAVRAGGGCVTAGLRAVALANACAALRRVGRLDEARYHGERSVGTCRRHALDRTPSGLLELGELALTQGRHEQARLLLAEAADLARRTDQAHVLVPVLAALVRVLAEGGPQDRAEAAGLALEACERAPEGLLAHALVAQGWLRLRCGDAVAAADAAARAVDEARRSTSVPALAEALELRAAVGGDVGSVRAALGEAHVLWTDCGAVVEADRLAVLLGGLPGSPSADRVAGREAARRLLRRGAAVPADASGAQDGGGVLEVRVLGGFDVRAGGRPVPTSAWRSRQARVLVKILVARRGRPVPRAQVCELLWPDDDPQRTGHRLSVLLSVVRGVLDPAKAWPADHFVRADLLGLSIDPEHVSVDAEQLLRDTAHAEEVLRDGDEARARELLAEVDRLYRGDAFDEEPYEDWASGLREEVRAAWLRSLRRHAGLSHRAGEVDAAVADLVRLLVADPYDESAHLTLVRVLTGAGRHGEARRAFDRWTRSMEAIEAPTPDPAVLAS